MESSIFLNHVTVILFYSFLHISVNARLEKAIDVTVNGTDVAKSGVQRYTLYGKSPELTSFNCTVKNVTGTLKNVEILKDGKVLGNVTNNGTTWTNTFLKNGDVKSFLGNYTCRARFSVTNSSGRQRSYTFDVITEVVMQEESKDYYLIASSVGSSVYAGEQVSMFCDGYYVVETESTGYMSYNDGENTCPVYLKGSANPVIHVPFGMNQLNVTCDLRPLQFGTERNSSQDNQDEPRPCCKEINLTLNITKALTVSLTPSAFANVDDGKLSFVCTSDPPRLMYWTVMATSGNVLDFSYHPVEGNLTINITQQPGMTTLEIQEPFVDSNGMHTVICATYDTQTHVITSSSHERSALNSGHHSVTSTEIGVVSITLMTILSVIVCILIIAVVYLFIKLQQVVSLGSPPKDSNADDDDKLPSGTDLQDNPVYLSYSDTNVTSL